MLKDIRYGFRALLQAKGWTAVVVTSLAIGIGANAAIFSAINGLLLRKIPVKDPDSLVRFRHVGPNDMAIGSDDYGAIEPIGGRRARASFSYPMFQDLAAANRTLEDMFACAPFGRVNVVVGDNADTATAFISSGNYYRVLGVNAIVGRVIVPEDDRPTAPPVAVISHRYWQSRFGADANVVGKVVRVANVPMTIIGVLPSEFTGVQRTIGEAPDIAFPIAVYPQIASATDNPVQRLQMATLWWVQIMGRLRPGVTAEQVQGNLAGVFQSQAQAGMRGYLAGLPEAERFTARNRGRTSVPSLFVESGSRGFFDASQEDKHALSILSAVVVLVLLIVCANVANLLLARATTRQKEISVRLSIGATKARLIRQLLTESIILALIGGGLGVLVGYWGTQLLPGALGETATVDWRLMGFVAAVAAVTGIVFGIAPALRASRIDISTALKETSRSVILSRTLLSKALLVVQVAVSLVLLICAGLFVRTVQNLRQVDIGFNPNNLVLFDVDPRLIQYEPAQFSSVYEALMARLQGLPGVEAVTFSDNGLLSGGRTSTDIVVQGRSDRESIHRLIVPPNFFETIGMPVRAGRLFGPVDTERSPKVAVINETAARKYFPIGNPVGQRFGNSVETTNEFEVIGVLRDAKYASVRDAAPPTMYLPFSQSRPTSVVFEVRTAIEPGPMMVPIREAVRQLYPNLPLTNVSTQIERIEQRFVQEQAFAQAYTLFGGIALALASIGLFGLMSYSVGQRVNEIGIRMAIGAEGRQIQGLVVRESMVLVFVGIATGLVGAVAARQFVASLLFGVAASDSATIAFATLLMILVSAVAVYVPARRAARVDPLVALRYE